MQPRSLPDALAGGIRDWREQLVLPPVELTEVAGGSTRLVEPLGAPIPILRLGEVDDGPCGQSVEFEVCALPQRTGRGGMFRR